MNLEAMNPEYTEYGIGGRGRSVQSSGVGHGGGLDWSFRLSRLTLENMEHVSVAQEETALHIF